MHRHEPPPRASLASGRSAPHRPGFLPSPPPPPPPVVWPAQRSPTQVPEIPASAPQRAVQARPAASHLKLYPNLNPRAAVPVDRAELFTLTPFFDQYRLTRGAHHEHHIPHARYIFVSQANGDVRMHPHYRHPVLAEGQAVRYAGEAEFRHGQLVWWSNASGNYRPDATYASQAGLPMECFYTHEQIRQGVHRRPRSGQDAEHASRASASPGASPGKTAPTPQRQV